MLILGRRPGESIVFPGLEMEIIVTRIEQGRVSLGFKAPLGIEILRKELVRDWDVVSDGGHVTLPEGETEVKV